MVKIKKLFNKLKNKIISDDSYINDEMIYNGKYNFMILYSFSKEYFTEAIEFISICSYSNIKNKFIETSYEENVNNNIIIHNKYYLLISGSDKDYCNLFYNTDNLSNPFIDALITQIYYSRNYEDYSNVYLFSKNSHLFDYYNNVSSFNDEIKISNRLYYDDIKEIFSKLPKDFTSHSILRLVNLYYDKISYSLFDALYSLYYEYDQIYISKSKVLNEIFSLLVKNPTDEKLKNLVGPQYLVQDIDDEISGDISPEYLDNTFTQQYEKFNAVVPEDENVIYKDIDEIITDEEGE